MAHQTTINLSTESSWLDYRHPEYEARIQKWKEVDMHYTGDLLESSNVSDFLHKRAQGETDEAYRERSMLADYTPHLSTVIDELAGMVFAVESEANREWGDLGDPKKAKSMAYRLRVSVDGKVGWITLWKQLAVKLLEFRTAWIVIDRSASGAPTVQVLSPMLVTNWLDDGSEVMVRELVDQRTSVSQKSDMAETYVLYKLKGWERWTKIKSDTGKMVEKMTATGDYKFRDRDKQAALPIFRVDLPLEREVGWLLARKAGAIFNKESERDTLLRTANFPRLNIMGSEVTFENVEAAITSGSNLLQNEKGEKGHHYIAPDVGPATIASKVLERKVEEFWVTAFREYGDSAQEKTATEIKAVVAAGVGAALQMVSAALDDAENEALWRVEQVAFAGATGKHFKAHVERSENFTPQDMQVIIEQMRSRYFGADSVIPLGIKGKAEMAKQIASWEGIVVDDGEINEQMNLEQMQRVVEALAVIPIPAEGRAKLATDTMKALGVDVSEDMEQEALALAQAQDTAAIRQAEVASEPGGF